MLVCKSLICWENDSMDWDDEDHIEQWNKDQQEYLEHDNEKSWIDSSISLLTVFVGKFSSCGSKSS